MVVNPLACVNGAERGTPSLACAPVVTRILYVGAGLRGAAGETVNVAFPLLATGAAAILTHFTKLLLETCSVPLQTAFDMLTVTEDGLAARLNVTPIVVPTDTPVVPSAGVADVTVKEVEGGVIVGVLVGGVVGVLVGVGVMVGVFVGGFVAVTVGVLVAVGDGVLVGVLVAAEVGDLVGVLVAVRVVVGVGVGPEPVQLANLKFPMRVRQLKELVVE